MEREEKRKRVEERREEGNKWTKSEIDERARRQDRLTHCRANVEERKRGGGGGKMRRQREMERVKQTDKSERDLFYLHAPGSHGVQLRSASREHKR